ncbi:carbohydrate-binding module family 50 protein [Xylariomycetidae sp. FL0641]|nr:carbohydrate-binding module family 50 protein [Xylariomycetidae sp. FL0641]
MGRWSQYDTDEERLPEGMQRIGYDADEETYTFRDTDGSIWESAPGNKYGRLHRVSGPPNQQTTPHQPPPPYGYDDDDDDADASTPFYPGTGQEQRKLSWRQEMMPLLNWFLLVGLFLLVVFWVVGGFTSARSGGGLHDGDDSDGDDGARSCDPDTATEYLVQPGDTCWAVADQRAVPLEKLITANPGIECSALEVGDLLCIPRL